MTTCRNSVLPALLAISVAAVVAVVSSVGRAEPIAPYGTEVPEKPPFLNPYEKNDVKIEAGFLPDKLEYVWGEPIHYFTYIVKNRGDKPFTFIDGGDYRGGRSESHIISALDAEGKPVPVPEMLKMGGIIGPVTLKPGEVYRKMLPVSRRLTFKGPGDYTVTGRRTLKLGQSILSRDNLSLPTETVFGLTIHPCSTERMAAVIEKLSAQIRAAGDIAPKPLESTEPKEINNANRLHLAFSSLTAIKEPAALDELTAIAGDGPTQLRIAALKRLGGFTQDKAYSTILDALSDPEEPIRAAAAHALGGIKTDDAVDTLIASLKNEESHVAESILRAMGRTKSQRIFDILVESLRHEDVARRRAAVDGLVAFGGEDAVAAIKTCLNDDNMDLREFVVRRLAESLKQPIDALWLVPVIKSRQGRAIGDAPRLLRLYSGEKAVPALLSCLNFDNPAVRSFYNRTIIYSQAYCRGALKIPWISDLNRNGTPEEIEKNRQTLRRIKAWVDHYHKYRTDEKPRPRHIPWPEKAKYWGEPADNISIRIRTEQHIWPHGMPQLIKIAVRSHPGEGSVFLRTLPDPLEVEINGHWYARKPALKGPTMGEDPGRGSSFNNLQLDDKWQRKSDAEPLRLIPGKYTVRVRLSTTPPDKRTALATSKPAHFQVIPTD